MLSNGSWKNHAKKEREREREKEEALCDQIARQYNTITNLLKV